MEKFKVTFEANDQQLKSLGTKHASDTYADIEATFVLGSRWTDMDSVSAVWWNDFTRIATVLDSQGKCIVPHEVLERKGYVRVNLVGSVVENGELVTRLTSYSAEAVKVNEKIKLTGSETSEITPSQYEQFVANVKADANRAEAGATASESSANSARTSADEAEVSAQNASESASASAVSASDSARSATASAGYAQNASESAQSAENAKDDAEDARDEILGMRATAETLEAGSDATASYSDGLLTLGIPRGDQGIQGIQGETGATPNLTIGTVETLEPTEDATATITGTAENPILNLGIPQGEVGEVSYADLKSLLPMDTASGAIVSIMDGQSVIPVDSLKVSLEPIQDLHGYDKPWAAGAGKNLIDSDILINDTYNKYNIPNPLKNGQTYTYSVYGDDTFAYGLFAGHTNTAVPQPNIPVAEQRYVRAGNYQTFTAPDDIEDWEYLFLGGSGNGAGSKEIRVQVEEGTVANPTYHPYSNICPISGRTEVVTQRTGFNQWDEEWELGTYEIRDGRKAVSDQHIRCKNPVSVVPNTEYHFNTNGYNINVCYMDENMGFISNFNSVADVTRTTPQNCHYILFNMAMAYGTTYNNDISINYPSTDHDYHAYDGNTYTTALGRTVYGGTLDVVSGELVVDRAIWNVPHNATAIVRGSGDTTYLQLNHSISTNNRWQDIVCSHFQNANIFAGGTAKGIGCYGLQFYIRNETLKTSEEWTTWIANNDLQICFKLATPQTYQLTPQQISLLVGENNLWSDGDVTIVYNADIQKWVEKKLNGNSTTSMLSMSRPMVQTETTEETETETAETE